MIKTISLILLMTFAFHSNASTFQYSQPEEIQQIIANYQKLHPQFPQEALQHEVEAAYQSNQHQVESISDVIIRLRNQIGVTENHNEITSLRTTIQQMQTILDIFEILKVKMNIPREVTLFLIHLNNTDNAEGYGGVGFYAALERCMYVTPTAFGYSPSQRIFTLIHELTHAQQHQRLGLLNFKNANESDIFNQEYEADVCAIQAIKCPVCIQLIEDEWPQDTPRRATEGYLDRQQVQSYKEQKNFSDMCVAHASHAKEAKKLRSLMPKESYWSRMFGKKDNSIERLELDFKVPGTAEDRLSSVQF